MARRLRWRIAFALNRMRGQCWSDLVMWALGSKNAPRMPWCPVTMTCAPGKWTLLRCPGHPAGSVVALPRGQARDRSPGA